jgi:hypothetical protein
MITRTTKVNLGFYNFTLEIEFSSKHVTFLSLMDQTVDGSFSYARFITLF